MANFETVEVNTDLLIVGGGFAACGAATLLSSPLSIGIIVSINTILVSSSLRTKS